MELVAGAETLVGMVRQANEDNFLVDDGLVAVADGMGGHLAGEVASEDTVATLRAVVGMREPGEMVGAVHLANRRVHDRAAENASLHGMGTTVCVLGVVEDDGEKLMALNVGDSRIYHYAAGVLTQITEDHSLVEALVRDGRLTPEEAEVHPQRNVLTRALGVEAVVEVDAWLIEPADGDRFLLCSDGLFNEITSEQIAEVLKSAADPTVAAQLLAQRAEVAGGRDNVTTVVVDVVDALLPASPVADRLRRVVVPPADLSDIEALLVAAQDESDDVAAVDTTANLPPVLAPLADDEAAFVAETPAEAAAKEDDAGPAAADSADSPVAAVLVEPDGGRSWRSKLFLLAVVAVVLVGLAAIAVGIATAGSDDPTTTTVRPTTTTTVAGSSTTTSVTVSTLPVVTVPTTLPLVPQPADTVAPAPGT